MSRRHRQRTILALAVLALVGWAWWQRAQDLRHAPGTLLGLRPDTISRVELQLRPGPVEHYRKRDGHWWRVDGAPVRADDGRLADLTEIASAPVLAWRPIADFEPARIGLDPPMAVLTLDGHRLQFGDTAATRPTRYVRVGARVAQVSVRHTPRAARRETTRAN